MTKEEAKEKIEKLREVISHHRYLYHVLDKQEISDAALDSLKRQLYKLEQEYPEFKTPDSPTQRVGGQPLEEFEKVKHQVPMLSMEDVFNMDELQDWRGRISRILPKAEFDYYAEVKMDGLAVSLIYENRVLKTGATRGDGKTGEDVTKNLKTIEAIPLSLRVPPDKEIEKFIKKFGDNLDVSKFKKEIKKLQGRVEVRGEAYMAKEVFKELNKKREKKGEPTFANPRNAAAGSIRQLDPQVAASRNLDFQGYDIIVDFGQKTHEQEHEIMKLIGIKVNKRNRHCKNLDEIKKMHEHIYEIRDDLSYWTDGIVVNVNDNEKFKKLGIVGKSRRGRIAFKFPAEQSTTVVKDVKFQVGRTGALTPVAVMEPVSIAGTTVTHATLHNVDEIERLGVKIGDTVIVEKAGDVIPKVVKVLPDLRTGDEKEIKIPKKCPICGSKAEREEGEVAIYCTNPKCFAQERENIIHFVSKKAFDIEGMGDKIVEQLIDEGLISSPADIFKLTKGDLEPLERFAEKSASNLVESIKKSKKIPLSRFLYSLGIRHVGEETAADLAEYFGGLEKIKKASKEDLEEVPDIGSVMAKSIYNYFQDKKNIKLIDQLLSVGVKIIKPEQRRVSKKLKGKNFVLTGSLDSMTREEAKSEIRKRAGDVSSSVSKKTDYVVAGEEPGSKLDKAKKLGVKIIDEKEFLKILKQN